MGYLVDTAARTLTLRNAITVAVVGCYLAALWLGKEAASDALSVPAGIAIGWAVNR